MIQKIGWFRGLALGLLAFGSVHFYLGCGLIEEPVSPSWQVSNTVPLVRANYSMSELLDKLSDDAFTILPTGNIEYNYQRRFTNLFSLKDSLKISFTDIFETNLGTRLTIPSFTRQATFTIGDIASASSRTIPTGTGINVSTAITGLQSPNLSYNLGSLIDSVRVKEGSLILDIQNNTGLNFTSITIELRDSLQNNLLLSTGTLSALNRNSSGSITFSLNNRLFRRVIRARMTALTIPTQNGVTVATSQQLVTTLRRGATMTFSSARVLPEAITYTDSDSLRISAGNVEKVREAEIKGGKIRLQITNPYNISGTATVTIPSLTQEQTAFTLAIPVQASQTTSILSPSLSGWKLTTIGDTAIRYTAQVSTNAATSFVNLSESMPLRVSVITDSLKLSSLTGVVWNKDQNKALDFNIRLDPLLISGISKILKASATINPTAVVNLQNFLGFGALANPILTTYNARNNQQVVLRKNNQPLSYTIASNGQVTDVFQNSNSNISPFILSLPDSIVVSGKATLNPTRAFGTVTDTSSVSFLLDVKMPFSFTIDTVSVADTFSVNDPNLGTLKSGTLEMRLTNGISMNFSTKMIFLDTDYKPVYLDTVSKTRAFVLPRADSTWQIRAAGVNSSTGQSTGSVQSLVSQNLFTEEIEALKRTKYARMIITIDTKQSGSARSVIIREEDLLNIQCVAKFVY
ncbi:MAG: hypothetical protein SFU91_12770 [Chloroherpetonaceae bacterium]|nr:hypothetical protein [Chloroherpetonaceae bacterium]